MILPTIPGYTLLRPLGRGGMATVYLARQESLGREVALKLLEAGTGPDASVAGERFMREARIAAGLRHPHIVPIHDFGVHEGTAYLAMEYEPGGTVAPMSGEKLAPRDALRIVRDIAGAIDYAHGRGIVHRDIKPDNILRRDDGAAVLSDFGIARLIQGESLLTTDGTSVGTPQYMSPEQLRGEKVDGRSDLYSLGVVLWQLLTGELPYTGNDSWAIGSQHINAPVPRLPEGLATLQPLLDALLAKTPGERLQGGSELVQHIDTLLAGVPTPPTERSTVAFDARAHAADGLRTPATRPGGTGRQWTPPRRPLVLVGAFMAIALLAWLGWRQFGAGAPGRATGASAVQVANLEDVKSIAVMPFLNMSADKEQDYFSDGMTEEILNALSKVPKLEVTARTSVFSLKGQNHDVRELGKMLGVAYLLEGSVRKAGDEVRITAQLIRTDNGFHVWSETYDRKLDNVFALQAELAGAIAQALQLPLGMGGDARLVSERTADAQAYAMFLQARSAYRMRGDGVKRSIDLYRAALKRDPKFAPAWSGLAISLAVLPWYVSAAEREQTPAFLHEAEQAASRALALAPDLPQAHTALGTIYNFEWKWALAEPHFLRALALAPNDPEAHYNYADWLAAQGRLEEALQEAQRTVALDPLVPIFMNGYANVFTDLGRDAEAIGQREAAYALAPDVQMFPNNLASAYIRAERLDDAEKILDDARASSLASAARSGSKVDPQLGYREWIRVLRDPSYREVARKEVDDVEKINRLWSTAGDIDAAFKTLETAIDKHTNGVDPVILLRSARFLPYRKDPRYLRLLRKAGFNDDGNMP